MRRRFLLSMAVFVGIVLACFGHLVWNGWHARKIVAESLPPPPISSGFRDVDLWHPTASPGHVYDLTFEWSADDPWRLPEGTRLEVQLASGGRTRLLVVRKGHPNTGVSWWDVFVRRERLQIVSDREWIDLGPLPAEGTKLEVQVYGLLPGPFGFAEQYKIKAGHFTTFRIRRPDSPRARPAPAVVRYRFAVAREVPAAETLARFFFFVSASRVLQAAGILALTLLVAGWCWLWEGRVTRAVAALVPAVTLLHACCLPPFQGADEAKHVGTVEAAIFNPGLFGGPQAYPKSLAAAYDAVGYDRFASHASLPVPMTSPESRAAARTALTRTAVEEAHESVSTFGDAAVIDALLRTPLYYSSFKLLRPLARRMSALDRLEAYVVLSAAASLAFFLLGLLLLARARVGTFLQLVFGLVALVPYSVGVVASCSNYSPAIGIGAFLAACALVVVLSEEGRQRRLAGVLFVGVSLVGIGVWDDFAMLAAGGLCVAAAIGVSRLLHPAAERWKPRPVVVAGAASVFLGLLVWALTTGRVWRFFQSLAARRPRELGGPQDPTFWVLLGTAAAPFVAALLFAFFLLRARSVPEPTRVMWARLRTGLATLLFVALFLATPWSAIPFETVHLDLPDLVAAHWASFWSNNFAWDQDVLFWKQYWGVFGYADVSYPGVIYALARWGCVALFLALPVLSVRFTIRRPVASATCLLVSGFALSACVVTNSIRHLQPALPWGRFILPLLPLAALPVLARTQLSIPERFVKLALAAGVILHLWTAIALLGTRYAIGL